MYTCRTIGVGHILYVCMYEPYDCGEDWRTENVHQALCYEEHAIHSIRRRIFEDSIAAPEQPEEPSLVSAEVGQPQYHKEGPKHAALDLQPVRAQRDTAREQLPLER